MTRTRITARDLRRGGTAAIGLVAAVLLACATLPPGHRAVLAQDLERLRTLPVGHPSLSAVADCATPLMLAAELDRLDVLRLLLARGVDPNQALPACNRTRVRGGLALRSDHGGQTALMRVRSVAAAELLVGRGARLEARDLSGDSVLLHAVLRSDVKLAHWLLARGLRPDTYSASGENRYLALLRVRLRTRATESDKQLLKMLRAAGARDRRP